jgi:general secretion pathway protein A
MYKAFYHLQRNPFEITPDPSFLFATRSHNEALAALYYGVRRRKGFVVITGEVGTGKTLLVRCLLDVLYRANVAYAYVFNPRLNPTEFLEYIAGDLRLPVAGKSKSELLLHLGSYLTSRHQKNLTTVLVVDEAHHLSAEVLEEVRLLTNLETPQAKLLQILLIGQPELDQKLDSVDLRQLKQRIAMRSQLSALNLEETRGYIHCRLRVAGHPRPAELFPTETVTEVHCQSRGIPRLINTLCENALIQGYGTRMVGITPRVIHEIAADFRLNVVHPSCNSLSSENGHATEVERAARTLLDLYASLQRRTEPEPHLRIAIGAGAKNDEPYI